MNQEIAQAEIKQEITADFILGLYDEMKQMPQGEEKQAKQAVIEVLSEHVGDWLVLDD